MAALPTEFAVLPLDEIDPHTLGVANSNDAPPRDEWPSYLPREDRWDVQDNPPARMPGETYRMWLSRLYLNAAFWADQDAQGDTPAEAPVPHKGRPATNLPLPGETAEDMKRRLNREAQARWRAKNNPGIKSINKMSQRQLDLLGELTTAREQLLELQAKCQWLKTELNKPA